MANPRSPNSAYRAGQAPTVDAIIPVYDGADHIVRALDSIAAQTHSVDSIIVVDDGSNDGTGDIVEKWAIRNRPVKLIRQENSGPSAARNAGIRASGSAFVALLDADDQWAAEKIKLQMRLFDRRDPRLGAVYCEAADIGGSAASIGRPTSRRLYRGDLLQQLRKRNVIRGSASGIVVRRDLFAQAGYFDENLTSGEDWDMWLRLARTCTFDFEESVQVLLRRRPPGGGDLVRRRLDEELLLFDKFARQGDLSRRTIRSARRRMAQIGLVPSDFDRYGSISPTTRRALASPAGLLGHAVGTFNRWSRRPG